MTNVTLIKHILLGTINIVVNRTDKIVDLMGFVIYAIILNILVDICDQMNFNV